jgi:NAD(P)-dependent dehydrogenase (short-subunit alcohol dehydrogenase family)
MYSGALLPSVDAMTISEVAIVTGASRGLGLALAGGLAEAGSQLIIDARGGDSRPA